MNTFIILITILSTIEGLEILGIPISKILLIILTLILALRNIGNIKKVKVTNLLIFYFFTVISGLISLGRNYDYDYRGIVLSFIVQVIIIYIPLLLLIYNDKYKYHYYRSFIKGIQISVFIHAIWGIMQMVLYAFANFDLNKWLFADILGMNMERGWSLFYYTGSTHLLRMSGLNFEPAMFALILCIGIFIEKRKGLKVFYTILIAISLSRTGLVMCIVTYFLKFISEKKYILTYKFYKSFIIYLVIIFTIFFIVMKNDSLNYQVKTFVNRFNFKSQEIMEDGTGRHMKYYPRGVEISLFRSDVFETLFGYGPRISGIAFNENKDIADELHISSNKNMAFKAWTVESDNIAILLGHGLIGLLFYWMSLYSAIKRNKDLKYIFISIMVGGIMYHFYSITLINIILIFSTIGEDKSHEHKGIKANMSKE